MLKALRETPRGDDAFEVDISAGALPLLQEEIELTLGYENGSAPDHFVKLIEGALGEVPRRCTVRAGYRLVDVHPDPGRHHGLELGGVFFQTDVIVSRLLRHAERAALFVVTIGPGMEDWSRELINQGDAAPGYIVDTVASAAVESATDVLHDHLGAKMRSRGWNITNRYSPGYCNWPVAEQRLLFSLLPPGFCGIALTESSLMVPVKSISGVIGTGPGVRRVDYTCDRCGMKDCTYRAVRSARRKSPGVGHRVR
jgi:hypothetical protein